jgi:hypothetical protein
MRKVRQHLGGKLGRHGGDLYAEQVVCLLRDLAKRSAKGEGVDSDHARRQLQAINRAARQVLVAVRTAAARRFNRHGSPDISVQRLFSADLP